MLSTTFPLPRDAHEKNKHNLIISVLTSLCENPDRTPFVLYNVIICLLLCACYKIITCDSR